jgi:hypothetical protein
MLIRRLFFHVKISIFIIRISRKLKGILFSKGLCSLNAFFRLQSETTLRLKYFQTFIKILCVKTILKYLVNTKHI